MSDVELFEGLKNGEREYIVAIYENLLPKVIKWVVDNNGTKEDACDVFQETLETILLKVDNVHNSFSGLVMTISKNKWIDKIRKNSSLKKTRDQLELKYKSELEQMSDQLMISNLSHQKFVLMEKHFDALSETCKKLMTLIKQGTSVNDAVKQLSFSNANSLYRRKAACMERWRNLIIKDSQYRRLFK